MSGSNLSSINFIALYQLQVHCDVLATSIQACPRRENRAKSCYASCLTHNINWFFIVLLFLTLFDKFRYEWLLHMCRKLKHSRTEYLKVVRKCFSKECSEVWMQARWCVMSPSHDRTTFRNIFLRSTQNSESFLKWRNREFI